MTIGGGTGPFAVLSSLKRYPCSITAIVTMADSGGSSRRLMDEFGQLPLGDLRQALVALSRMRLSGATSSPSASSLAMACAMAREARPEAKRLKSVTSSPRQLACAAGGPRGRGDGHSLGNLIISALQE